MEQPLPASSESTSPATGIGALWRNRRVRALAQLIVVGLILVFFIRALAREWDAIQAYQWQVQPWYLLAGAALTLARGPVILAGWRGVLARLGFPLRWAAAVRVYFAS